MSVTITLEQNTQAGPGVYFGIFVGGKMNRVELKTLHKVIGLIMPFMEEWEFAAELDRTYEPGAAEKKYSEKTVKTEGAANE
jgi:hypothetical protein